MAASYHLVRMHKSTSALLLAAALVGGPARAVTLEEVIERNTKAMGGRVAIEAIRNVEMDLHIIEPTFAVDAVYRAARSGRMRIDVSVAGKHALTEAFDGETAWQRQGDKAAATASPEGARALRRGVELPGKLFGLHELQGRGHKLELLGRENIAGRDYHALRLTMPDGYSTNLYVDPTSWLITRRRDVRPLHVDVDPTPTTIEQVSSHFRTIAGVQFAFLSVETDLKTGEELSRAIVRSIKVNAPLDGSIFKKP